MADTASKSGGNTVGALKTLIAQVDQRNTSHTDKRCEELTNIITKMATRIDEFEAKMASGPVAGKKEKVVRASPGTVKQKGETQEQYDERQLMLNAKKAFVEYIKLIKESKDAKFSTEQTFIRDFVKDRDAAVVKLGYPAENKIACSRKNKAGEVTQYFRDTYPADIAKTEYETVFSSHSEAERLRWNTDDHPTIQEMYELDGMTTKIAAAHAAKQKTPPTTSSTTDSAAPSTTSVSAEVMDETDEVAEEAVAESPSPSASAVKKTVKTIKKDD